jgi:hypothetical protein
MHHELDFTGSGAFSAIYAPFGYNQPTLQMDDYVVAVLAAAEELGQSIKPVVQHRDGRGGYESQASAFVIAHGDHCIVVTANHVVADPGPKLVILGNKNSLVWPARFNTLEPLGPDIGDADLAYITGTVLDGKEIQPIGFDRIAVNYDVVPDSSFLAIGFPRSQNRVNRSDSTLRRRQFFSVCAAAPQSTYHALQLDPRVHISVRYDPARGRLAHNRNPQRGADPHGMSGGILFTPVQMKSSERIWYDCLIAGVLVGYHPAPDNILVATRIDCLADAIAPARAEVNRTHRGKLTQARLTSP